MQKLIKRFVFDRDHYSKFTLSDPSKIRLNVDDNRLELVVQSYRAWGQPVYSTDTDLTVTTWVTNPNTVQQWLTFNGYPSPASQPSNTLVQYRISDGTDERYWSGSAWDIAGAGDWNDEDTVSANIAAFPVTTQKLGVVINLVSTDGVSTPTVEAVELLMSCEIDYIRSIVSDAMIPALRSGINPVLDYAMRSTGGTTISLLDQETSFNIIGVDAVYDHDSDPQHTTNLLSSYDAASKTLTLSSSIVRGKVAWIRFQIEPEVYLNWSSQDYLEVEKVPAIAIDSFTLSGNQISACQISPNRTANTAILRRNPFKLRIEFDIILLADGNRTLLAMMDKALAHASTSNLLAWPALDEQISMTVDTEGLFQPSPNLEDKHSARYTVRLDNVHFWLSPEETVNLIQNTSITLTSPELQYGHNWTGVKPG